MLTTYKAILHGNVLEWLKDAPHPLSSTNTIHVHVTILDEEIPSEGQKQHTTSLKSLPAKRGFAQGMAEIADLGSEDDAPVDLSVNKNHYLYGHEKVT